MPAERNRIAGAGRIQSKFPTYADVPRTPKKSHSTYTFPSTPTRTKREKNNSPRKQTTSLFIPKSPSKSPTKRSPTKQSSRAFPQAEAIPKDVEPPLMPPVSPKKQVTNRSNQLLVGLGPKHGPNAEWRHEFCHCVDGQPNDPRCICNDTTDIVSLLRAKSKEVCGSDATRLVVLSTNNCLFMDEPENHERSKIIFLYTPSPKMANLNQGMQCIVHIDFHGQSVDYGICKLAVYPFDINLWPRLPDENKKYLVRITRTLGLADNLSDGDLLKQFGQGRRSLWLCKITRVGAAPVLTDKARHRASTAFFRPQDMAKFQRGERVDTEDILYDLEAEARKDVKAAQEAIKQRRKTV